MKNILKIKGKTYSKLSTYYYFTEFYYKDAVPLCISSQLHVQWHHISRVKSLVGEFTPQKLTNAINPPHPSFSGWPVVTSAPLGVPWVEKGNPQVGGCFWVFSTSRWLSTASICTVEQGSECGHMDKLYTPHTHTHTLRTLYPPYRHKVTHTPHTSTDNTPM